MRWIDVSIFVELPVEYYPEVGVVSGLGFALGGPFVGFHHPRIDQGSHTGGVTVAVARA